MAENNHPAMHPYLVALIKQFAEHANAEHAKGAKAYMLHQFNFYGLKATIWRSVSKHYFQQKLPPFSEVEKIIKDCRAQPEREMQYTGIELLACYKKQWQKQTISIIAFILTHKSWCDTVDHAATELTGPYFKLFPGQLKMVTNQWNQSTNI